MIAIFDYGAGNLCSVANALHAMQVPFALVKTAEELQNSSKIILPGVGHFGQMMRSLDAMQVRQPLIDAMKAGVPFLGICLGMQALFEASDEAPDVSGLGLLPGRVRRFAGGLRVPHMGWNRLQIADTASLFAPFAAHPDPWFYFAHSYYVPLTESTAASCNYSVQYTAAIEYKNIFGVQFHPEKSASAGQLLLSAFLAS